MKKKLTYFLCVFCLSLMAQQKQIDSLVNIIHTAKNDTAVANSYNAISNIFAGSNPDTIIPLSNKVFAIIDKNFSDAGKREQHAYLLIKADALNNLGYVQQLKGDFEKARLSFQNALRLQEEAGAKEKTGLTLNNIAVAFYRLGKMKESLDNYNLSLKVREEFNDQNGIAQSLSNMGAIYYSLGQTESALDHFFRSMKMREKSGDRPGLAFSLNNIASIYQNTGQIDKALDYFKQSLNIHTTLGNKEGMANALHNIGGVYDRLGKWEQALAEYKASLKIYESLGNKLGLVNSFINIGGDYAKLKKNKEAMDNFMQSLSLAESIGDKRGIAFSNNNMGTLLLSTNPKEAIKKGELALAVAIEGGYVEAIRNANLLLAKSDSALGNSKGALEHYKQYIIYRDSLFSETTRKTALKKQLQYEYEKKEDFYKSEQKKKEAIQQEEIKVQKIIYWSASGAIGLALLSTSLLFNRRRLKEKNKFQQQLNEQQKEQANAVMETQESERKRIAEDLHDSLGHLLSTVKLNLQTQPIQQKQVDGSLSLLNQASEEIRNITFNLMPRTLEEGGLIPALNELASKVTNTGMVKVFLHVHDMDKFTLEKQSQFNIYRIVQEAVNNILKHAAASEINIQVIGQADHITIMIEDDGKGFNPETNKSGRGLKNIVTRSLWLKGNINIDSTPGKGTTITTEFPI